MSLFATRGGWVGGLVLAVAGLAALVWEARRWDGFAAGATLQRGVLFDTRHPHKSFTIELELRLPEGSAPRDIPVECLGPTPPYASQVEVLVNPGHYPKARLPGWRGTTNIKVLGWIFLVFGSLGILIDVRQRLVR